MTASKTVIVEYYAQLREQSGRNEEPIITTASTVADLYTELQASRGFSLPASMLKVAVNAAFSGWDRRLEAGDRVVFIPPVAGG